MSDQKPVDYEVFLSLLMSDPGPGAREDAEATASPVLAAMLDEFAAAHGVDCVDRDGRTLLMNAVTRGRPDLVAGLIERGADVDASDGRDFRALHFAALEDDVTCAGLLLDAGAAIDPRDGWGNTPLWRAAMTFEPDAAVTAFLLARGADPSVANDHGVAPQDLLG